MNVNELMNMNDMYYVGNIIDVDGDGWVSKQEAQSILDELGVTDTDPNLSDLPDINFTNEQRGGYGDESPAEYKRMLAEVGIKI